MIIKGHWGGSWAPETPMNLHRSWKVQNLRWTLPETSCRITSTFKHLASCCPPKKKTYMFNPAEKYVQIGNLPPSFGVQIPSVYLKPPNGWNSSSFRNWFHSKELIVSNFPRSCLAHATLQKGQFWQFSPWEDVKKTTSITSPNDGLPWLASTLPKWSPQKFIFQLHHHHHS